MRLCVDCSGASEQCLPLTLIRPSRYKTNLALGTEYASLNQIGFTASLREVSLLFLNASTEHDLMRCIKRRKELEHLHRILFFVSPVSFPATRGSYQIPAVLLHTSHPHRVMLSALLLPLALTASAYAQQTEAQEVAALREAPAAVDRIKILNQDSDVSTEIRPTREFNE